jgi:hypothetical protein
MNAWIIRLLGGAACTAGALALGVGVAQAQEQHHVPADVRAVVSVVSTVTGSHHHSTTAAGKHVVLKGKSARAGGTTVHLAGSTQQTRAISTARVGSQQHSGVRTVPAINPRPVRKNTLITTTSVAPRPARAAASAAEGDARADVLRNHAVACARINSGGCGTGHTAGTRTADKGDFAYLGPTAVSDTDVTVIDTPATACVRVNAGGCGTADGGSDPNGNPNLPTAGGEMTATVGTVADDAGCVRINGGSCGSTSGSGTDPVNAGPGTGSGPVRADSADHADRGSDRQGHTVQLEGARNGSAALTADAGADGQDPSLAHTGADAGLLPALLFGLLALLASVPLLRRRRNG